MSFTFTDPEHLASLKRYTESPENQAWLRRHWIEIDRLVAERTLREMGEFGWFIMLWTGWEKIDFIFFIDPPLTYNKEYWDNAAKALDWSQVSCSPPGPKDLW